MSNLSLNERKKIMALLNRKKQATVAVSPTIDILKKTDDLWRMSEQERMEMTISCRDTDYIKKVKDAGVIKKQNGVEVQVMHNGLLVKNGGYHGTWMSDIITSLKGHHEPQEEKIFYEVLKRLEPGATMIELGCFWSYYSVWFNTAVKDAKNICCEPDPVNLALGKENASLNNTKDMNFVQSAAGADDGAMIDIVMESDMPNTASVPVRTVDSLLREFRWKKLDILHMDVQGFEMSALQGALESIKAKKVRFLFVSTHHYLFSDNPNTHGECMAFIKENGGSIISSHTIPESFSGDGLIVASFDPRDEDFKVETSLNHTDKSIFRPYEEDLAILLGELEKN
jgi:FkbM family methyltransferase